MNADAYSSLRHDLRASVRSLLVVIDLFKTGALNVGTKECESVLQKVAEHSGDLTWFIDYALDELSKQGLEQPPPVPSRRKPQK